MPNNLIAEIAKEFISGNSHEVVDIVTFCEAPWGLNIRLLPAQRFLLKAFYGLPLDSSRREIKVPDMINERVLYTFTEKEFLVWLKAEGRCNTDVTEGRIFQEIIMVIGRRGTKCRDKNDLISTTAGSICFGELHQRLSSGERIGVPTYDPTTLRRSVSYGLKSQLNGNVDCYEVVTKRGIRETSSWNHPYLIWRDDWEKPEFIEMSKIRVGDRIATSSCTEVFGLGRIGTNRAALLGHFQGDGGTTCSVVYTTASEEMLEDVRRLIGKEFPGYVVNKKGKDSFRLGYQVVKESGKFSQNGSQKNDVKEWLKEEGCFGKKATDKEIPSAILTGNKEEVCAFLSRLFGCDGHATTEKRVPVGHGGVPKSHVGYCSASQKMTDGVRHLLLKFGIHSVVTKIVAKCDGKEFDAWILRIVRKDSLEKFRDEINIFSKEAAVEKAVLAAQRRGDGKNEFDCIPRGVWKYVRRVMKERGLSGSDVVGDHGVGAKNRLRWNYSPSRWKVVSYGERICDDFLREMGTSDVLWDEVKELTHVGVRETVDIEVPGTHIIGGDLVSHNSTLAACISNYEMYKLVKRGDPSKFYGFPPQTLFAILNVAPTDETAHVVFDMTQQMAMKCPYMKGRSIHQTMEYFDLQTDEDIKLGGKPRASLVSISGGCASNGLRGRNGIVVIMDEMAHFIDNAGRFSGTEVYKALTPSIASFRRDGKIICISSPYAKYGVFYERYVQSLEQSDFTLMFKMYSAMVNPTIPSEVLRAARRNDRNGFLCEYGGEFSDSVTAWIDDEVEFKKCVTNKPMLTRGLHDVSYFYGIDLGFRNDGTSVAIAHKEPDKNQIVLDYANVWYSGSSDVWTMENSIYKGCRKYAGLDLLRMSDIVAEVKELTRWFPAKEGVFDQHNGYALAELFMSERLKQFRMESFTDITNSEVYQLVKRLYAEKMIVLPDHDVLIPEMLTLEAEKRTKEKTLVRAPNRAGAHDDISDAVVRAIWLCYSSFKMGPANVTLGSGSRIMSHGVSEQRETQSGFVIRKLKMHGEHPRGLYNVRGRRSSMAMR